MCRSHPIVMAVPAALIVLVTLVAVAGSTWLLTGDFSHTEFLVRAIPRHPPLIGVAARVKDLGSTPGPSMAYLLYPFYKLFGSSAFALAAAVDVLHVAGIAGAIVVARRIGGTAIAAFVALSLTATAMAVAPRFFLEPWNVWVPVFAFAVFLVLVWGLACEHVAMLPFAVAIGSHCIQTHISYTVLVTGLLAGTIVWLGYLWWRTDRLDGGHPLRWLLVSVGVFVVAWLPPVIQQLQPGTGNLRKLYDTFSNPSEPFVGARASLKAYVGRFNLFGPWIMDAHKDPRSAPSYIGFVLFVTLVGVSTWWAWRRRERVETSLFVVLSVATLLGLISTMRIFGPFFEYVIRWMSPLVALWIAASCWSCWLTWKERRPAEAGDAPPTRILAGLLAVAAVVTVIGISRAVDAAVPYQRDVAVTEALSTQLQQSLDPTTRYQIDDMDPVALGSVVFGLALDLPRHGLHAGVGPWGVAGVMPFRVVDDAHAESALWYVAGQPAIDALSALPDAQVQAFFDPRSPEEAKRSDELEAQLLKIFCDSGHPELRPVLFGRWGHTALEFDPEVPPEAKTLLHEYTDLRLPAAVVELPVGVNAYNVPPDLPPC